MSDRCPVVDVDTTCHILVVVGHIAARLNDDTKSRIVGECINDVKDV